MSTDATLSLRSPKVQFPVILVSLGHAATHWIAATFYVILPFITRDLGLSYTQTGVIVMCFHIGSTLANVPSGTMVDLTGRRVVFQVAALVIGSLTLLGIGIFEAYFALAAMVAVMGAANMMWHPAAISFLSGHLPKNRGYALSIHALGANLGDAVAPPFVGWMMLSAGWRTAAEVNALTGFLCAAAILLCLSQGDGIDVNKVTGLDLKSYFGGMARALRARAVWSLCLMAGFRTMTQGGLMMFLPLYLANDLKLNPFLMGVALMMLQVGGMIASPVAGTLSDRIGRRPIVLAGMAGTTLLVLGLTLIDNTSLFITCVSFLGFVMYAMRPVIHSWLMDRTPPELAASMTSAMFGTQAALSALTPVIGGFLADAYGLLSVFYFLAAMVLIANLLALAVPKSETAG